MKDAAELAELRSKGRERVMTASLEKGRAKSLSFRERGAAADCAEARTKKLNVFATFGWPRIIAQKMSSA
jgi:hypothetical protein